MRFWTRVNAAPARHRLDGIADRALDLRHPFRDVFTRLEQSERRRWQTHGFGRWAPDEDGHPPDMFKSGDLFASLTTSRHQLAIRTARKDFLVFGTRAYYARFHQKGEGTPKRTVVGVQKDDRRFAADRILDFVTNGHR